MEKMVIHGNYMDNVIRSCSAQFVDRVCVACAVSLGDSASDEMVVLSVRQAWRTRHAARGFEKVSSELSMSVIQVMRALVPAHMADIHDQLICGYRDVAKNATATMVAHC